MAYYIVTETFDDRVLGGRRGKDTLYPPPGVSVPEEWLEKLASGDNACKRPFLRPVEEALPGAEKTEQEPGKAEQPPEKAEQPPKPPAEDKKAAKGAKEGA